MNRWWDVRAWLTAIMIGLTGWLGMIATSSYNTLVELSYQFKNISDNIVMLKDTLETNNQSMRIEIDMLKNDSKDLQKRVTWLEAKGEK